MMQFFYGCTQTVSRIPLHQKAGSGSTQDEVCKIYAWHQPDQFVAFHTGADHTGREAFKEMIS